MSEFLDALWAGPSAVGVAFSWLVDHVAAGSLVVLVAEVVALAALGYLASTTAARRRPPVHHQCDGWITVAGPHEGCAEFGGPEFYPCAQDAVVRISFHDPMLAAEDGEPEEYEMQFCHEHADEARVDLGQGASITAERAIR